MADAQSQAPSISAISLDGSSVRLRPITRADYGFMWQCRTHPEILYLWMQDRTLPSFELYAHELDGTLSSKVLTTLLIETIDGSAPVGYVFAYDFSAFDHTTFINIVIHPTYVRYGWAAEASILFLNYLFTYFDLRKASMDVFAFNQLALTPLLQLGARVEGRFRGQRYYQGAYHDIIRLAVMHEEWDQVATRLLAALMHNNGHMAEANPFMPLPLETESQVQQDVSENDSSPHRKKRPRHAVGSQSTR
ncbi:MAG TPA: GNAT family protein [Ktedonobacterales bacterium]|jgi:RimJ/RimL family protein N-acetyltransferase